MCQTVFRNGALVAFHANERTAEGASGGASHKTSRQLPDARRFLEVLGRDLGWHGALSADVILSESGPLFIDINPRLVEPANAWRSGVDLVGALLEIALGSTPPPEPDSRPDVATHQLLLAVLGAAQRKEGRGGVAHELLAAARRAGGYARSTEELTPAGHDPLALLPVAMASLATLVRPASWSWFASGSVENYALSPAGWEAILAGAEVPAPG
jgi:hypothetical protein